VPPQDLCCNEFWAQDSRGFTTSLTGDAEDNKTSSWVPKVFRLSRARFPMPAVLVSAPSIIMPKLENCRDAIQNFFVWFPPPTPRNYFTSISITLLANGNLIGFFCQWFGDFREESLRERQSNKILKIVYVIYNNTYRLGIKLRRKMQIKFKFPPFI